MTQLKRARQQKVEEPPAPVATDRGSRAYETLRELIVHGRVAPGARVAENELAARLGMSRTPIRSALQRLQREGYVVVNGSGRSSRTIVAPLTREDMRGLFDVVAALEGVAARSAATLEAPARRALVGRMRQLNSELRVLSRSRWPDPDRRFENDNAFHRCYVEVASPRVRALHDSVKPQAERYIRVYINLLTGTSVSEHVTIVEALAGGDATRAQHAVESNWRNAAARLDEVIDKAGEKGSW